LINKPIMEYHFGDSLNQDSSNWFTMNTLCLQKMLEEFGFKIDRIRRIKDTNRLIVYSTKKHKY